MGWRYSYLIMLFVPLIILTQTPLFSITGLDILNAGRSAGGELSVGGDQTGGGFTGIPTVVVPSNNSGSGSGSGESDGFSLFDLGESFFPLEVKKGINYEKKILIISNSNTTLTIDISINLSKNFVFSEDSIVLSPKESREIVFNIFVPDVEESDIYTGKIYFDSGGTRKTVDFILDVKDRSPLFDIKTTILGKYVFPGGKVRANVLVLNLGDLKNIDVGLEYYIRDLNNNTYAPKKEMFAINDSSEKEIFIETPGSLEEGDYLLFSKVSYKEVSANSYDTFFIRGISYLLWMALVFSHVLMISFILGMIIYFYFIRKDENLADNYEYVSSYG